MSIICQLYHNEAGKKRERDLLSLNESQVLFTWSQPTSFVISPHEAPKRATGLRTCRLSPAVLSLYGDPCAPGHLLILQITDQPPSPDLVLGSPRRLPPPSGLPEHCSDLSDSTQPQPTLHCLHPHLPRLDCNFSREGL